jgi:alpha-L-rhamnosidase
LLSTCNREQTPFRYQCYDATEFVREGKANAVGVTLGNGQYRGPWTHAWSKAMPPLAFTFGLYVTFTDGTATMVGSTSDESAWSVSRGPLLWSDVYTGEDYNASAFVIGWDKPGFDDKGWAKASRLDPTKVSRFCLLLLFLFCFVCPSCVVVSCT